MGDQRSHGSGDSSRGAVERPEQPSRSLEKVREILFGPRSREAERRLLGLEDRVETDLSGLQTQINDLLTAVASLRADLHSATKSITRIDGRLDQQATAISDLQKAHEQGLAAAQSALEDRDRRLTASIDAVSAQVAAVAAQGEETERVLKAELGQARVAVEDAQSTADQAHLRAERLQNDVLDRQTIARLFKDLAAQMTDSADPSGRDRG